MHIEIQAGDFQRSLSLRVNPVFVPLTDKGAAIDLLGQTSRSVWRRDDDRSGYFDSPEVWEIRPNIPREDIDLKDDSLADKDVFFGRGRHTYNKLPILPA